MTKPTPSKPTQTPDASAGPRIPVTLPARRVTDRPATACLRYTFRSRVLLPRPRRVVSYNQVIEVPADVAAELLALGPDRFVLADDPPAAGVGPGLAPDPEPSALDATATDPPAPDRAGPVATATGPAPAIPPADAPSVPR